ncbi:hypothetical protein [Lysobacter capsici]|uniref:hypothetical protein n=1 Tax=Lysobacter capsici TaxID=435897 RepID=UPI001BFFFD37|nr:hypothetical protein [Lysobacter capsici]QWF19244.1 hypothetical protein KME82_11140 [Lysobacter capsici]
MTDHLPKPDTRAFLVGECDPWPTRADMVHLLYLAGLDIEQGHYTIHVRDCECLSFEVYGEDLDDPEIEGSASTYERLVSDARLLSAALTGSGVRHWLQLYQEQDQPLALLHHDWPDGGIY